MDFKAIQNLIKEMNQSDLTLLELEENGVKIKMQKDFKADKAFDTILTAPTPNLQQIPLIKDIPLSLKNESKTENKEIINGKNIVSPIVGTFYRSSAPNKPPFVKVGDKVKKGQILCIIEAMKLMNEIESEYDCEILEILVENEQKVEYNQPLFKICEI